ncbi:MAG: endolytic transglycosylase MltG [Gemmatimonadota bacterium]|nr:endolytic transglycosylase MltG [Gemmatimonadota bacterium]
MRTTSIAAAICVAMSVAACGGPHGAPVRVIVPRGATFRVAAESMASAGVIGSPLGFRIYARMHGRDRQIQAGTYLLRPGTPWGELVGAMNGGVGIINRVTIPEGFTIAQITPLLVRALHASPDSVTAAVRDSGLRARLADPAATLEGYLFPDTYVFAPGTSAREAVTEMVQRFEREWKPAYDKQASAMGRSRHEIVTMASIVEKEARVPEERPVIAAVYYNRLRLGMPLQADPTVQFAMGHHTDRVLYRDLAIDSPYNTYLHPGLPPGPIASPGAASLRAALEPAKVPYLYFVAAADGHHEFRETMAEHDAAKRAVRGKPPK